MRTTRRTTGFAAAMLVLSLLALLLGACGSANKNNDSSEGTASPSPSESKKEPVMISLVTSADWYNDTWKEIVKRYETHSGNKVDVQLLPGGKEFRKTVNTRLATQDFPDVLFYYGNQSVLGELQAEKNLVSFKDSEFVQRMTLTNFQGGYAAPVSGVNASGVLYNKGVFEQLNIAVPQTYDELLAALETVKKAGITPVYVSGKDAWTLQLFSFAGFANVFKDRPDVMEQINTHKLTFPEIPELGDLLRKQVELKEKGYYNDDLFSATYDGMHEALANGTAAMTFTFTTALPAILSKYPDADIGMFPLPYQDNYVQIFEPNAAYVFKNAKHASEGQAFIDYITSPEILEYYYGEIKEIPVFRGINVEPDPITAPLTAVVLEGKTGTDFAGSTIAPISPFDTTLQDMLLGNLTPDQVTETIQANMEKAAKLAGVPEFK